jgi:SAM-dependent methyltransferase
MNSNVLVSLFGFPATLIHGDTLVLDRWRWLKARLPVTANRERLLDVGCGTGAFTIGAALRGYSAIGLSWDDRNQRTAQQRATICRAASAAFDVLDVRALDEREDLREAFDAVVCLECIEHILDDRKLMGDMARCLKPGGRLLLTTPYFFYPPITSECLGPFQTVENGGHVRRGYGSAMLKELCEDAGLVAERITYCSGFFSQKVTGLLRRLSRIHPLFGWTVTLPLRVLPLLLDPMVARITGRPPSSICLEAYKPRFSHHSQL